MAKQLGFFIDQNYCTGCKTCQIVCKDKNDLPDGVIWRRIAEWAVARRTVTTGPSRRPRLPTTPRSSCNHCADPICVKVCPTTAISKGADGIVSIDEGLCVGCRLCDGPAPTEHRSSTRPEVSRRSATSAPTSLPRARSQPAWPPVRPGRSSTASCLSSGKAWDDQQRRPAA